MTVGGTVTRRIAPEVVKCYDASVIKSTLLQRCRYIVFPTTESDAADDKSPWALPDLRALASQPRFLFQ